MAGGFTEQSQRFRPSSKEEHVVQKAEEHFERTLITIRGELAGSVAALEHPSDAVEVEPPQKTFGPRHKSVNYHTPCPDKALAKIENNKNHSKNIAANNSKKASGEGIRRRD